MKLTGMPPTVGFIVQLAGEIIFDAGNNKKINSISCQIFNELVVI